jgi:glycosyltransferase involved in cell wall biosynthesis
MTTRLNVIVDQIVSPVPGGIGRYTEELARELIRVAPPGCEVAGYVSASQGRELDRLRTLLPGIAELRVSRLRRRELQLAWGLGLGRIRGRGMVHATSLLAPLGRHDRLQQEGDQVVVTIHDVVPWTHPDALTPRGVAWHKAMARRAHRFADAVVVPSHTVASQLGEVLDFKDRIRVIGGAVSSKLALPVDVEARAQRLGLPEHYLLSVGTLEPRKGLGPLIQSLRAAASVDLPLLVVGPPGWGGVDLAQLASDSGLPEGRVRAMGFLTDADLAVALHRASVFVFPSLAEGFGLPVIEAFSLGVPVVHSSDPAVVEVAGGAGVTVELDDRESYPERLASAIASVVENPSLADRLRVAGLDRARAYSWRDSAEKVWQLHADL